MKKINLKSIKKGLSLMEVVVAIAISMVTMTITSIYTTQLINAAQRNFFEASANEYESIVIEQLRLIESNLQEAKSQGNSSLIKTLDSNLLLNPTTPSANSFCGNPSLDPKESELSLNISFPDFFPLTPTPIVSPTPSPFAPKLRLDTNAFYVLEEDRLTYNFYRISGTQLTGAMRTAGFTDVGVALTRVVGKGSGGAGDTIIIKVKFAYKITNQKDPRVTKTTDVKMIREFVC